MSVELLSALHHREEALFEVIHLHLRLTWTITCLAMQLTQLQSSISPKSFSIRRPVILVVALLCVASSAGKGESVDIVTVQYAHTGLLHLILALLLHLRCGPFTRLGLLQSHLYATSWVRVSDKEV